MDGVSLLLFIYTDNDTYLGGDLKKKYKGEVGTLILLDVISDMHLYYHCDNF